MAGSARLWNELSKNLLVCIILIFSTFCSTDSFYLDSDWPHPLTRRNLPKIDEEFDKNTLVLLIPVDLERPWHRRTSAKSRVELGPGAIKSTQVKYPEKYFEKKMKYLLRLQEKEEKRKQQEIKPKSSRRYKKWTYLEK